VLALVNRNPGTLTFLLLSPLKDRTLTPLSYVPFWFDRFGGLGAMGNFSGDRRGSKTLSSA